MKPHIVRRGVGRYKVVFLVVVWHYLHTIEIAVNKRVLNFIFVREIQRGKKSHYLHTIEIAANKGFRIFSSVP